MDILKPRMKNVFIATQKNMEVLDAINVDMKPMNKELILIISYTTLLVRINSVVLLIKILKLLILVLIKLNIDINFIASIIKKDV